MSKTNKLKKLFEEWKEAHNHESDSEYRSYKITDIKKDSFCNDGIICEEKFDGLLFIGKESHIDGDRIAITDDSFWLRKVANNEKKPQLFGTRLTMIANAYFYGNYTDIDTNKKDNGVLSKTAILNLNKRGGKSSTSYNSLRIYTEKYSDKIIEEIKIINPKIIVVCGVKELFDSLIKEKINNTNIKYIYLKHPSYRRISHKNYLADFQNQIENS